MPEPVPSLAAPSSSLGGARRAAVGPIGLRIAPVRAALALVWAAALVLAVGDRIPTTASEVTVAAALLLTAYPLIDAVSSLVEARAQAGGSTRVLTVNAAISAAAAAGLAVATFAGDAATTLIVFGAWASASGAIQLAVGLHRRRAGGASQWPMIASGGLSAVVGLSFVAAAGQHDANLSMLAGYAAFGAVLYLVWTARARAASRRG